MKTTACYCEDYVSGGIPCPPGKCPNVPKELRAEVEEGKTPEGDNWTGTWCPQCGSDVGIDEDGCCTSCGCVAVGDGAEQALACRTERDELRAEVERLTKERDEAVADSWKQGTRADEAEEEFAKLRQRVNDLRIGLKTIAHPQEWDSEEIPASTIASLVLAQDDKPAPPGEKGE